MPHFDRNLRGLDQEFGAADVNLAVHYLAGKPRMNTKRIVTKLNRDIRQPGGIGTISGQPIIRAREVLTAVLEWLDSINIRELDAENAHRIHQAQIFVHEALMVITDD